MGVKSSCVICHSATALYTIADNNNPATYKCKECGLVQVDLPTQLEQKKWMHFYTDEGLYHKKRVLSGFLSFHQRYQHDLRLARVRMENLCRLITEGKLLDVGTSNGAFIMMALQYGFDATGLEIDSWVVERAKLLFTQYDVNKVICCASFEDYCAVFDDGHYHCVTFIDSFEHLLDPHTVLEKAHWLLRPEGILMIEAPDADSPEAIKEGFGWKHFKPNEHAFMYGKRHILRLLAEHHFNFLDTIVPYPERRIYYASR